METIEQLLLKYHTVTINNEGDCLTTYKVQIQHYSATVFATDHVLATALETASENMEAEYPTIESRLPKCI
jgi:hypothetical protein